MGIRSLMLTLPCQLRAQIRDHVLDLHRCLVVQRAAEELSDCLVDFSLVHFGVHLGDKAIVPSALLEVFDRDRSTLGERAARDAVKSFLGHFVSGHLVPPMFGLGGDLRGLDYWREGQENLPALRALLSRNHREVLSSRDRLYRAIIGTSKEFLEINEFNCPVYED